MAAANRVVRNITESLIEVENDLNTLWGQPRYVLYKIENGTVGERYVGGDVIEERLDIKEGDKLTALYTDRDGNEKYEEITAGTEGSLPLNASHQYFY